MKCNPLCVCTACIVNEGRVSPFPEKQVKTFKSLALYDDFVFAPMADGTQLSFDIGKRYRKTGTRSYVAIDITGGLIAGSYKVGSINVQVQDAPASVNYEGSN